jgi:hypothetical protein
MSYQEKKTLTSITSGVLVLAAYCLYAFNPTRLASIAEGDLKPWAATILIFIGIGIVFMIIIQIVFHILFSISLAVQEKINNNDVDDKAIDEAVEKNIELEMVEDEMDKLIELKANQVGFAIAGFGFIAALVSLILNYSPIVMINILFIAFSFGSLCEGFAQLFYYRRGVRNA